MESDDNISTDRIYRFLCSSILKELESNTNNKKRNNDIPASIALIRDITTYTNQ